MDARRDSELTSAKNPTTVERTSDRELVVRRTFNGPARIVFEDGLPFAILSDADRSVTTRYGLLDQASRSDGIAVPTQLLVRTDGTIAWRHVATKIQDRAYPSETLAEMEATIRYAMSLPVDRIHISNFLALPGTPIFAQLLAEGAIDLDTIDWESYLDNRLSYSPDGISHARLRWMMKKGFFRFYFRPKILRGLFGEIHNASQLGIVVRRAVDTFL